MITFDPTKKSAPTLAPAAPAPTPDNSFMGRVNSLFSGLQAPQVTLPTLASPLTPTPPTKAPVAQPAPVLAAPSKITFTPATAPSLSKPAAITFAPPETPKVEPYPAPRKVTKADWEDAANILPYVASKFIVEPALSAVQSLREVKTNRSEENPLASYAADKNKGRIQFDSPFAGTGAFSHLLDAKSANRYYQDQIDQGVDPEKAFFNTGVKTVGDISVLIPLAQDLGKATLLHTNPASLIKPEIVSEDTVNFTRSQIQDYLTGRRSAADVGIPDKLRESITEILTNGTREEKTNLLKGTLGQQTLQAQPSRLGKLFGISQEEADKILTDYYGGPVREAPVARLPGYVPEYPKVAPVGLSTEPVKPVGFGTKSAPFEGFQDLTTNTLDQLKGKTEVSKQFISDLTNRPELKQTERDVVRQVLEDYPDGKPVPVQEFAEKVHSELLPLTRNNNGGITQYENISLPENLKGEVANYSEHVYQSPVKTSAGNIHFGNSSGENTPNPRYFGHTRVEDTPGNTRRVIEVQSDLYQKGRLEGEKGQFSVLKGDESRASIGESEYKKRIDARRKEVSKLEQYSNPTAHFRMVREEVKQAAIDGKTKLQFPTGETAMKIEGLGVNNTFTLDNEPLKPEMLKVGAEINNHAIRTVDPWVVTDVLGEGKFKAVPKTTYDSAQRAIQQAGNDTERVDKAKRSIDAYAESFDISGKVDTNNPIYKFYEKDLGRYLKNTYGAELVTDKQGVKWYEVPLKPEYATQPVTAYKKGPENTAPNIDKAEAEKLLYSLFDKSELDLVFDPDLLKKEGAYGLFKPGRTIGHNVHLKAMIKLLDDEGKVSDYVGLHEAFHAYFNKFLTQAERNEMIGKVKDSILTAAKHFYPSKEYPTIEAKAEEWLADDFAEYVKSKAKNTEYTGFFRRQWERVLAKLRDLIRRKNKFDQLYEDILNKKRGPGEEGMAVRAKAVEGDPLAENAKKLNQLYKQLDRESQSLRAFEANPEAHIKAYGEDRSIKYKENIARLNAKVKELEDVVGIPSSRKEIEAANKTRNVEEFKANKKELDSVPTKKEDALQQAIQERDDLKLILEEDPAKDLIKYVSPTTGRLPEVAAGQKSIYGQHGDNINEAAMRFNDLDEAQAAVDRYQQMRKRFVDITKQVASLRREVSAEKLTKADEKSQAALLNKSARVTEGEIAKRDRLAKQNKDLIAEEEKRQKQFQEDQLKKTTLQEKINQAHYESAQSKTLLNKIKQTFVPVRALDSKTNGLVKEWLSSRGVARDAANKLYKESFGKGPQNLEEINAYEAGKNTPYIRNTLDDLGTEAKRLGLDFGFRENYLPHAYLEDRPAVVEAISKRLKEKGLSDAEIAAYTNGQELPKEKALRLKLTPNFAKERIFPSYSVAAKYGLSPKFRTPSELLAYYKESLEIAKANRTLLDRLKEEAKLLPSEDAPDSWEPVTLRFAKEGLYAPPELARLLNGRFRDDNKLTLRQSFFKVGSAVSKFMFDARTMAGVPGTTINNFAIGQANKFVTAALGDVAAGDFKTALSDLKASFAFIRANSNSASKKFFEDNTFYLTKMAENGITLHGRPGSYEKASQAIGDFFPKKGDRTTGKVARALVKMTGLTFHKLFTTKTTNSMLGQMSLQIFKDNYDLAISKGLEETEAAQFATKTAKTMGTILEDVGRSPDVQETLSTLLTAPVFREGVAAVLADGAKSYSSEFKNPLFYKSRRFVAGMAIVYALYNLLNKKTSDHYMWDNTNGHEFDLRLPFPNGDVVYVPFMPSFLAFARNIGSGILETAQGDFKGASQKFGSLLSTPVQLATELWANRDYFGRAIYKDTDDAKVKVEKMATYAGLSSTHPFIQESYKYISGQEPLYQALSVASELPFKFGNKDKEATSRFYDAQANLQKKRLDAKGEVQKIYENLQQMKANGDVEGANKIYNALPAGQKILYKEIKTAVKTSATKKREPAIQAVYDHLQELKDEGRPDEANAIYYGLSSDDRRIYNIIRNADQKAKKLGLK